jgi:ABC-2 type transport system ATP-binding protein
VISVNRLSRSFNGIRAVEELTFDIPKGKLFTLLGPNGAGKTTTVRMLMGLIAPTSGTAKVAGFDLGQDGKTKCALREACGLLTETPGFYERMSAWDNLLFFGRLYGIAESALAKRLEHYLKFMDLWDRRDGLVGTFSKGMKQKLAIIRAIFHEPKVIFMDEPTAGLDPETSLTVREMILQLKGEGRTIIVCTHNLMEAERLADIIGILKRRLLIYDSLQNLQTGTDHSVPVEIEIVEPLDSYREMMLDLPFVGSVEQFGKIFQIEVAGAQENIPRLVRMLAEWGMKIMAVRPQKLSLEDIYMKCMQSEDNGVQEK